MTKVQEDINVDDTRTTVLQAQINAEAERVKTEAWRLNLDQNASNAVYRRRYQSHLPPCYEPTHVFNTLAAGPSTPGATVIPQLTSDVLGSRVAAQPHRLESARREKPAPAPHLVQTPLQHILTPPGHFSYPVVNLVAAATRLTAFPITGESLLMVQARNAIKLLQTVIVQ